MAMMKLDDARREKIALSNSQVFSFRDSKTRVWHQKAAQYRKNVFSNPFSQTAQTEIRGYGLDPRAFLPVHDAVIDSWVGLMMSNKNSVTVIPKKDDPTRSYLWQVIISDIMRKSHWLKVRRKILEDQASSGIGFALVDGCDDFNDNIYGTVVKYMDYEDCRWDNTYSDPFMQDLDDFCYYTMMSVKSAIIRSGIEYDERMFGDLCSQATKLPDSLKEAPSIRNAENRNTEGANENQLVPWIQVWSKEYKQYLNLIEYDKNKENIVSRYRVEYDGGDVTDSIMSYFINYLDGDKDKAQFITNEFKKNENSIKPLKEKRVIKNISIGGLGLASEVLPTKLYPFIPFKFKEIQGAAPIGLVERFDGLARAANQAFQLEFLTSKHNASKHYELPAGVANKEQVKKEFSQIIGIVETTPQNTGTANPLSIREIPNSQNPSNLMSIVQFLINFIEKSSGIDDVISGTYSGTPPSGDAVEQLQKYGGLKFRPFAEDDQDAMCQVGRVLIDFAKANTKLNAVVRIFENDPLAQGQMSSVGGDMIMDHKDGKLFEISINKRDGEKIINDIHNTDEDVDVVIVAAPFTESQRRQAASGMALTMQQAPETSRYIIGDYLNLMEYPQAHSISQKLDNSKQLEAQVSSLNEQLTKSRKEIVNLMQQLLTSEKVKEVTKESQKFKSTMESLINEVDGALKNGKIDKAVADETKQRLESAIEDMDKIIFNQPTVESTAAAVTGG